MSLSSSITAIESPEFPARVGLANSYRLFLRNIAREPAATELVALCESPNNALRVLERVNWLRRLGGDIRYLNRFDAALAVYVWVLSRTQPDLAAAAAEAVAAVPRTWWADQTARHVLSEVQRRTAAQSHSRLIPVSEGLRAFSASNAASGNSIIGSASGALQLSSPVTAKVEAEGTLSEVSSLPGSENPVGSTQSGTVEITRDR